MCWCTPTTQRWSLTSTTREVCLCAPFTGLRTRSLCGPRTSSSRWEQFIFLGISIWEQTSCWGRGRGPGNGCFTPRWWSRYGEFLAKLRWICCDSSDIALSHLVLSDSSSSTGAGCYGTDLVSSVRLSPDRSAPGSSRESAPGRGPSIASRPVLTGPSRVLGPDFSPRRLSMGGSRQEGSPLTGGGHDPSPLPGVVEAVGVALEGVPLMSFFFFLEAIYYWSYEQVPNVLWS